MKFSIPLLAAATVLAAQPAQAQVFLDGFVGRSFPEAKRATITADQARVNGTVVPAQLRVDIESLEPSNSTIFGARLGYWFGAFGLAVDASTLDPDVKAQTITASANLRFDESVFGERVTIDPGQSRSVAIPRITVPTTATLAGLAMVRLPRGGVQPYAFAGPVYLVTDSDISGDWGLRAGGGARLAISRSVGLFAEYRYTRVNASAVAGSFGGTVMGVDADSGNINVGIRLRNHSAVGGVSFQF